LTVDERIELALFAKVIDSDGYDGLTVAEFARLKELKAKAAPQQIGKSQ
jgi:hypothetical protein